MKFAKDMKTKSGDMFISALSNNFVRFLILDSNQKSWRACKTDSKSVMFYDVSLPHSGMFDDWEHMKYSGWVAVLRDGQLHMLDSYK